MLFRSKKLLDLVQVWRSLGRIRVCVSTMTLTATEFSNVVEDLHLHLRWVFVLGCKVMWPEVVRVADEKSTSI
jgi:hypothetical protein